MQIARLDLALLAVPVVLYRLGLDPSGSACALGDCRPSYLYNLDFPSSMTISHFHNVPNFEDAINFFLAMMPESLSYLAPSPGPRYPTYIKKKRKLGFVNV